MPRRLKFFGVGLVVAKVDSQMHLLQLALTPSSRFAAVRDLCIYLDSDVFMRTQDGHQFFSLIASDQKYSTLSKQTSATVTGHVINSVKARLRQCHTSGGPCMSDRSTPVNTPRCSTFDDWLTQVRPRLFIAPRPSLVVSPSVPCIDWPYLFFAAITTLRLST